MKKCFAFIFALCAAIAASAQELDWNVDFQYLFNNCEYDASHNVWDPSCTLNAARITPTVGVRLEQNPHVHHHLMLGLDFYKNMGEGVRPDNLAREMTLYYDVDAFFRNGGRFNAIAGMYPRTFLEGDWRGPFFDDALLFTDNNMEGMAFKYRNRGLYAEIGLDWMGMLGDTENPMRRERFQVLSSGDWDFLGPFHFGWRASFYHFANSVVCRNVVDNHMVNPWLEWRPSTWFEDFSVKLGFVGSYQRDRRTMDEAVLCGGFLTQQRLSKWHFGIDNSFYYGADLMPLYENSNSGIQFGRELYFGEECYHTMMDGSSWCDQLALYYEPYVNKCMRVVVASVFHFGQKTSQPVLRGSQQIVSLRVNLDKLRPQPTPWKTAGDAIREFFFGRS